MEDLKNIINTYIFINRKRYEEAVKRIKEIFKSYQRSWIGQRTIYNVSSRGDYQAGDELKTIEIIFDKILNRREKNPNYSIDDVNDVIGLRLVCPYPSDIEEVVNFILLDQNELFVHEIEYLGVETDELYKKLRKKLEEKGYELKFKKGPYGYRGIHFIVSLKSPLSLQDLKCEIQVMTMLQMVWSVKSHDLIYKGRAVDKAYKEQLSYLSDQFWSIDRSSETIKKQVLVRRKEGEERRMAIYLVHSNSLLKFDIPEDIIKMSHDQFSSNKRIDFEKIGNDPYKAMNILVQLIKNKTSLEKNNRLAEDLAFRFDEKYEVFKNRNFELSQFLCHMITIIAINDKTGRYYDIALHYVDKLIRTSSENSRNRIKALITKGFVCYGFGKFKEAVDEMKKALKLSEKLAHDTPDDLNYIILLNRCKNSLAYYAAEQVDKMSKWDKRNCYEEEELEKLAMEAKEHILGAIENVNNALEQLNLKKTLDELNKNCKNELEAFSLGCQDTLSFIKIVCSSEIGEVKEGLRINQKIWDEMKDKTTLIDLEILKIYQKKHQNRAFKRLDEFL